MENPVRRINQFQGIRITLWEHYRLQTPAWHNYFVHNVHQFRYPWHGAQYRSRPRQMHGSAPGRLETEVRPPSPGVAQWDGTFLLSASSSSSSEDDRNDHDNGDNDDNGDDDDDRHGNVGRSVLGANGGGPGDINDPDYEPDLDSPGDTTQSDEPDPDSPGDTKESDDETTLDERDGHDAPLRYHRHDDSDEDSDHRPRNHGRRHQMARVAAFILLNSIVHTGALSPVAGSGTGRTRQHVTYQALQMLDSRISSASGRPDRLDINIGRRFRLRRALSAPALDDVLVEDGLVQKYLESGHVLKHDPSVVVGSHYSSPPAPFPAYRDVFIQDPDLESSRTKSKTDTSCSAGKHLKVQCEDQGAKSKRAPPAALIEEGLKLGSLARVDSPNAAFSSTHAASIAYHRIGSSVDAAVDGPSPSTTYSPAHRKDGAPFQVATPNLHGDENDALSISAAPPQPVAEVEVSPWVQHLHENERSINSSHMRPRRRSRLARFIRRIFRREHREHSMPKVSGLKRLWQRVKRRRSSSPGSRGTPPTRMWEPRQTPKPVKKAKPTKHAPPPAAAAKSSAAGKQKTKSGARSKDQVRGHRTAKEVVYDILSPRAEAKAKRALETAPLLGAANTVFMAAS